jgi:DNA polymerase I
MSCRPDEGGTPLCKLGFSGCRSIEIRGKSLASIEASLELNRPIAGDDLDQDYDLFIILGTPDHFDDLKGGIGFGKGYNKIFELTAKAGFKKNRVFVTHLTKCKPPKRPPTIQEINTCREYLKAEIKATQPKVIMPLGAKALRAFNLHSSGGINKIRGNIYSLALPLEPEDETWNIVPSLDPGVFFYSTDPKIEQRVLEDYRKAYQLANTGKATADKYISKFDIIEDLYQLEDLVKEWKQEKLLIFDTESRALPWSVEPMICMSFSTGIGKNYILPIYRHDPDGIDWKLKKAFDKAKQAKFGLILKDIFEDPNVAKGAHNIKYDINVIRKHLGIKTKGFTFDSMLMHHIINEQGPHSLEYLSDIEFGVGSYSEELHKIVGKGKVLKNKYDSVPDDILYPYAATDAECCYRLVKLYYNQMQQKPNLWKLYCEETESLTHTLADAEWHGHYIDKKVLNILNSSYTKEQEDLLDEMVKDTFSGFNPSSSIHVRNALIQLGYETHIRDPKKATGYTTSREKLMEFKEELPLASNILNYRNVVKMRGTYLENVSKDIDKYDRVRYSWLIHGTESGRLSCRFYHQIPRVDSKRKYNLRDMLAAPDGKVLVYFDYNQIELRVLAILAQDLELIQLFKDNKDVHRATASTILGWPEEEINDFNRQNCGKNVNFGLAYGSEGYRLVQTGRWEDRDGTRRSITWDMLNKGMDRFHSRFKGLSKYLSSVPDIARSNGGVYTTPFGRERRIGTKLNDKDKWTLKAAEREIVNFSIQSTAGAITCRTLNLVHNWIENWRDNGLHPDDLFLVNTVHDSGMWEVKKDLAPWFIKQLKKAAERPIAELDNSVYPCDIGVGQHWTESENDSKKGNVCK